MQHLGQLSITITQTADGLGEYVQICSPAAIPVNIVLVADEIMVDDRRTPVALPRRKRR